MEYLPIYFSDLELLQTLSYAQAGKVVISMLRYATDGKSDIPLSDTGRLVFRKLRQDYDRSKKNYEDKCSNYQKAALKREQNKRAFAQQSTIVQDFGEEKDKEKDKDKYEYKDKEKENASQAANRRAGAREQRGGKRLLKNNSECTFKREDLFVSIFDIEDAEAAKQSAAGDSR